MYHPFTHLILEDGNLYSQLRLVIKINTLLLQNIKEPNLINIWLAMHK